MFHLDKIDWLAAAQTFLKYRTNVSMWQTCSVGAWGPNAVMDYRINQAKIDKELADLGVGVVITGYIQGRPIHDARYYIFYMLGEDQCIVDDKLIPLSALK